MLRLRFVDEENNIAFRQPGDAASPRLATDRACVEVRDNIDYFLHSASPYLFSFFARHGRPCLLVAMYLPILTTSVNKAHGIDHSPPSPMPSMAKLRRAHRRGYTVASAPFFLCPASSFGLPNYHDISRNTFSRHD